MTRRKFIKTILGISYITISKTCIILSRSLYGSSSVKMCLQHSKFCISWQQKLPLNELRCKRSDEKALNLVLRRYKNELKVVVSNFDRVLSHRHVNKHCSNFRKNTSKTHALKLQNLGICNNTVYWFM